MSESSLLREALPATRQVNDGNRSAKRSGARGGSTVRTLRLNFTLPATPRNLPRQQLNSSGSRSMSSLPTARQLLARRPTSSRSSRSILRPIRLPKVYVETYGRPGGNVTGVFLDAPEFASKWLELLTAMVPGLSRVVVLWDPSPGPTHLQSVQKLARSFRVQLQVIEVHKPEDIDRAFSEFRVRPQALVILPSPMMYVQSERLAKLALKHHLPATSMARLFAESGGAITYGPDRTAAHERAAVLVGKILGGAKPADLPVERPTRVQLIVNLKTAKTLGVTIPESILLRADEVIR